MKSYLEFVNEKKWAGKVQPKRGKMHKLLGIPADKNISDVYTSGEKLAKDLVEKVGKAKAAQMINFVANVNSEEDIFDDAQKALEDLN